MDLSNAVILHNYENIYSVTISIGNDKMMDIGNRMESIKKEAYMNGYNWEAFLKCYLENYVPHLANMIEHDPEAGLYAAYPKGRNEKQIMTQYAHVLKSLLSDDENLLRIFTELKNDVLWD